MTSMINDDGKISSLLARERTRIEKFDAIWQHQLDAVFEDAARYYESANNVASFGLWKTLRRRFVSSIELAPQLKLLDVCAGANAIGFALLEKQHKLEVHAVDRSGAMQRAGLEFAKQQGRQIHGCIGDAHHLPYADASFDVVTMQYASRHLRVLDVVAEIKRVLKPGGRFYHCDMMRPKNTLFAKGYYTFLRVSLWLTSVLFGSSVAAKKCKSYFVEALRMFYSVEEFADLLSHAGFEQVLATSMFGGAVGYHQAIKPK